MVSVVSRRLSLESRALAHRSLSSAFQPVSNHSYFNSYFSTRHSMATWEITGLQLIKSLIFVLHIKNNWPVILIWLHVKHSRPFNKHLSHIRNFELDLFKTCLANIGLYTENFTFFQRLGFYSVLKLKSYIYIKIIIIFQKSYQFL